VLTAKSIPYALDGAVEFFAQNDGGISPFVRNRFPGASRQTILEERPFIDTQLAQDPVS
jgi:hypothetical protein